MDFQDLLKLFAAQPSLPPLITAVRTKEAAPEPERIKEDTARFLAGYREPMPIQVQQIIPFPRMAYTTSYVTSCSSAPRRKSGNMSVQEFAAYLRRTNA